MTRPSQIIYTFDLQNVDWEEMKEAVRADDFDNGRTPAQLKTSFENSYAACIAYADHRIIGTARVLSDGVCNAYFVDVWTRREHRLRGVARTMMELTLEKLPGQHVYLAADDDVLGFYEKLGFAKDGNGVGKVVGRWLSNASD
jgi:GNAT superfamily N-acetyltransferase